MTKSHFVNEAFLVLTLVWSTEGFVLQAHSTSRKTVVARAAAPQSPAERLQDLWDAEMNGERDDDGPILLPCCYDGLTARLIAAAGFDATFMTGFGVSAVNGYPDTQLVGSFCMVCCK